MPGGDRSLRPTLFREEGAMNEDQGANAAGEDTRIKEAETRTVQANTRADEANTRTDDANARTDEANTRTDEANTRTDEANTRTEEAEARNVEAIRSGITERELAEEAATRLAAMVNSSNDAIIGKDLNSMVTSWNAGAEKIFGYTAEEMIGQPVTRLIPPDRQAEELQIIGWIKKDESVEHFETRRKAKDGRLIDVSVTVSPIKDKEGRIVGASKVARDITDRKIAEAATAQLAAIVSSSTDAIIGKNLEGIITSWNGAAVKIFGYTEEEMVGQSIARIIPPDRREEEMDIVRKIKDGGRVEHFETLRVAKDGRLIDVAVTISPIKDRTGQIVGASKVARDISERKHAEAALRKSEQQFRLLVEQAADAFFLHDRDGRFLEVNHQACESLGYAREELLKMNVSDVTSMTEEEAKRIWDQLQANSTITFNDYHRRKDGTRIPVELRMGSLNVDGQMLFLGLARDITERKQGERKIQELNAHLEKRVAERTAELEAANKELEAFSYSVSHDLRSPLRAIDGFSQAVLEDYGPQLPEEGRRYLRTVREGAQRMGRLIDDLLAFSRLGRAPLKEQKVDMVMLARGILNDLESVRADRKMEVSVAELPGCEGDPALLRQVWINLLSNAFKYTSRCAAAVVEIGYQVEGGETVYFVRDNGAGFDMRYAGKLFGVFQRLHRADEFEGTGVGLAIAQRVIHRHGGRIWAEAAPNLGATFYFTLKKGSSV
jgi:PAS domain S-box-containing protein